MRRTLFAHAPGASHWLPAACLVTICLLSLGGCNNTKEDPDPFKTGAPVPPPAGCTEGRTRGVDC